MSERTTVSELAMKRMAIRVIVKIPIAAIIQIAVFVVTEITGTVAIEIATKSIAAIGLEIEMEIEIESVMVIDRGTATPIGCGRQCIESVAQRTMRSVTTSSGIETK